MNIDLTQYRLAGVNKSMRCVRGNDNDATGFCLARFIAQRDRGAAFDHKDDFDIRMRV